MPSPPQIAGIEADRHETRTESDSNAALVASEPVHLAAEEPDPIRESAATAATNAVMTEVTEAPCASISPAACADNRVQAEAVEVHSEPPESVDVNTPSRLTVKRRSLYVRNHLRALPFAADKDDIGEDEEKYLFSASIPISDREQRAPDEQTAYIEKATQLALRYFWQERFVFNIGWNTVVRKILDQEEKNILNALQRKRSKRSWREERSTLRREVYSVFVDGLGYVVTDDPELRRDSLDPKRGLPSSEGTEGGPTRPQAESS